MNHNHDLTAATAAAYDQVGEDYTRYADGDDWLCSGSIGVRGRTDQILWQTLTSLVETLANTGQTSISICDAGCGPGTWLMRICLYAEQRGLTVSGYGFDISSAQLKIARTRQAKLPSSAAKFVDFQFVQADLSKRLDFSDAAFDIVCCNYTVLNHIPTESFAIAVSELCRISRGYVVTTVRALGSNFTAFVTDQSRVRDYRFDDDKGQLWVELDDASTHTIGLHFYTAYEMQREFSLYTRVLDCRAVNLFWARFTPDERWTGRLLADTIDLADLMGQLTTLEVRYCRDPAWIDHGSQILIVACKMTKVDLAASRP